MDVNISGTRQYYHSMADSTLCSCAYCRSYRAQVRRAYPQAAAYLESLGADIEKPFETSPLEPDEEGMLEYCCCQYIVLGCCEPEYRHKIGDVEFTFSESYPSTGVEQAHFVLDMAPIRLKYAPLD